MPSATAPVLDVAVLPLGFAAAPSVFLLGALIGCAAGSGLAAALMLLLWPTLPRRPDPFVLPLLPALWVLLQSGRAGEFGFAAASFGSANLVVGLILSAGFAPLAEAIVNRCLSLFIDGLLSEFILRAAQTMHPSPRWEPPSPSIELFRSQTLSEGAFAST